MTGNEHGTPAANTQQCCPYHLDAWRDRKDLLAMHMLAPLSPAYMPWSVSAMRPSGVVAVLNEIAVNGRQSIVELGAGISSFYIGRMLQRRGGHLWTVEHDQDWADRIASELTIEGLDGVVTVVLAPLTPTSAGWDEHATWYAPDRLIDTIAGRSIDLLLIDGPPAYQAGMEHARYPALPFFAPLLADDYAIILDDIHRAGEQDIMERWERQFGVKFERRLIRGNIGIGRTRPAFTI